MTVSAVCVDRVFSCRIVQCRLTSVQIVVLGNGVGQIGVGSAMKTNSNAGRSVKQEARKVVVNAFRRSCQCVTVTSLRTE